MVYGTYHVGRTLVDSRSVEETKISLVSVSREKGVHRTPSPTPPDTALYEMPRIVFLGQDSNPYRFDM